MSNVNANVIAGYSAVVPGKNRSTKQVVRVLIGENSLSKGEINNANSSGNISKSNQATTLVTPVVDGTEQNDVIMGTNDDSSDDAKNSLGTLAYVPLVDDVLDDGMKNAIMQVLDFVPGIAVRDTGIVTLSTNDAGQEIATPYYGDTHNRKFRTDAEPNKDIESAFSLTNGDRNRLLAAINLVPHQVSGDGRCASYAFCDAYNQLAECYGDEKINYDFCRETILPSLERKHNKIVAQRVEIEQKALKDIETARAKQDGDLVAKLELALESNKKNRVRTRYEILKDSSHAHLYIEDLRCVASKLKCRLCVFTNFSINIARARRNGAAFYALYNEKGNKNRTVHIFLGHVFTRDTTLDVNHCTPYLWSKMAISAQHLLYSPIGSTAETCNSQWLIPQAVDRSGFVNMTKLDVDSKKLYFKNVETDSCAQGSRIVTVNDAAMMKAYNESANNYAVTTRLRGGYAPPYVRGVKNPGAKTSLYIYYKDERRLSNHILPWNSNTQKTVMMNDVQKASARKTHEWAQVSAQLLSAITGYKISSYQIARCSGNMNQIMVPPFSADGLAKHKERIQRDFGKTMSDDMIKRSLMEQVEFTLSVTMADETLADDVIGILQKEHIKFARIDLSVSKQLKVYINWDGFNLNNFREVMIQNGAVCKNISPIQANNGRRFVRLDMAERYMEQLRSEDIIAAVNGPDANSISVMQKVRKSHLWCRRCFQVGHMLGDCPNADKNYCGECGELKKTTGHQCKATHCCICKMNKPDHSVECCSELFPKWESLVYNIDRIALDIRKRNANVESKIKQMVARGEPLTMVEKVFVRKHEKDVYHNKTAESYKIALTANERKSGEVVPVSRQQRVDTNESKELVSVEISKWKSDFEACMVERQNSLMAEIRSQQAGQRLILEQVSNMQSTMHKLEVAQEKLDENQNEMHLKQLEVKATVDKQKDDMNTLSVILSNVVQNNAATAEAMQALMRRLSENQTDTTMKSMTVLHHQAEAPSPIHRCDSHRQVNSDNTHVNTATQYVPTTDANISENNASSSKTRSADLPIMTDSRSKNVTTAAVSTTTPIPKRSYASIVPIVAIAKPVQLGGKHYASNENLDAIHPSKQKRSVIESVQHGSSCDNLLLAGVERHAMNETITENEDSLIVLMSDSQSQLTAAATELFS